MAAATMRVHDMLVEVCRALPRAANAAGAALVLTGSVDVCASDPQAAWLAELQRRSGAGPLGYALRSGRPMCTPDLTRVVAVLEYHPKGLFEKTGNLWRAQGRRVRLELKHFQRQVMTDTVLHADDVDGWQGEIRDGEVVSTGGSEEDDKATVQRKPRRRKAVARSSSSESKSRKAGTGTSTTRRAGTSQSRASKTSRSTASRSASGQRRSPAKKAAR